MAADVAVMHSSIRLALTQRLLQVLYGVVPQAKFYELHGIAEPEPIEAAMYSVKVCPESTVWCAPSKRCSIVLVHGSGEVHCAILTRQPCQFLQH